MKLSEVSTARFIQKGESITIITHGIRAARGMTSSPYGKRRIQHPAENIRKFDNLSAVFMYVCYTSCNIML